MSIEDLDAGFEALADEAIRERVVTGDIAAAGELELTDSERLVLEAAASHYPEVIGHDLRTNIFTMAPHLRQKILFEITQDVTVNKAKTADKAFSAMDAYIRG